MLARLLLVCCAVSIAALPTSLRRGRPHKHLAASAFERSHDAGSTAPAIRRVDSSDDLGTMSPKVAPKTHDREKFAKYFAMKNFIFTFVSHCGLSWNGLRGCDVDVEYESERLKKKRIKRDEAEKDMDEKSDLVEDKQAALEEAEAAADAADAAFVNKMTEETMEEWEAAEEKKEAAWEEKNAALKKLKLAEAYFDERQEKWVEQLKRVLKEGETDSTLAAFQDALCDRLKKKQKWDGWNKEKTRREGPTANYLANYGCCCFVAGEFV